MEHNNSRGRVDIITRCRPDYSIPGPDATIYGFILEYGIGHLEFWADDPKDFFWRIALKKYDYHRVYDDFLTMAHGRSKLSKLLKPAFKFADEHQQPVYVNGVICSQFVEKEVSVEELLAAVSVGQ